MRTLTLLLSLTIIGFILFALSSCGPLGKKEERGIVEDPLVNIERSGPLGDIETLVLQTQYTEDVDEQDKWENPFIVLFTGNTGTIAGYWRVEGKIEYHGPKYDEITYKVACKKDVCTAREINAPPKSKSYIKFRTVDGCSFRWSNEFLVSEYEVTILKKPLVSTCRPTRTYKRNTPQRKPSTAVRSAPRTSTAKKVRSRDSATPRVVKRCPDGFNYSAKINKCFKCPGGGTFDPSTQTCEVGSMGNPFKGLSN